MLRHWQYLSLEAVAGATAGLVCEMSLDGRGWCCHPFVDFYGLNPETWSACLNITRL